MDHNTVNESVAGSESSRKRWRGCVQKTIKSPAEIVWKYGADFLGLKKYASFMDDCEHAEGEKNEVGCVRLCKSPAGFAKEKLISIDHVNYSYTYGISDNNIGLVGYMATFKVHAMPDGSAAVEYSFEADPSPLRTEEEFIGMMSTLLEQVIIGIETFATSE